MDDASENLAFEWLRRATRDLSAAEQLGVMPGGLPEIAVYHCQQAAEKALKGMLAYRGLHIPKTHNLPFLAELAAGIHVDFRSLFEAADELSDYATEFRYPGPRREPDFDEVSRAVANAQQIVDFVLALLPERLHARVYDLGDESGRGSGAAMLTHVVTVGPDGKPVKPGRWESGRKGARLKGELSALPEYVEKLRRTKGRSASLVAGSADGAKSILLISQMGDLLLLLDVNWRRDAELEGQIRAFFEAREILPVQDYLAGNGAVPDAVRILEYPLYGSGAEAAELLRAFFREIHKIAEDEAIYYSFEEQP